MADAAERYVARWGKDKITQVNADGRPSPHWQGAGEVRLSNIHEPPAVLTR